jgi:hypothetical protein
VRCSRNYLHESFNLEKKRCRDCSAGLEKRCSVCEKFSSYSNASTHLKKCKQQRQLQQQEDTTVNAIGDDEAEGELSKLRVAYVVAAWRQGLPSGQYRETLPEGFPEQFRTLLVEDPSGDAKCVDAYDAVWGSIFAANGSFECVQYYSCVQELESAIADRKFPDTINVLVVNDWIHQTAAPPFGDEDASGGVSLKTRVQNVFNTLRNLEMERGIRVFPPLEYAWYFAQKAHYLNHLQCYTMPIGAHIIPTMTVPSGHHWKKAVRNFICSADPEGAQVMFKREMSETSKHAIKMPINDISSLEGRGDFCWVAQPCIAEFNEYPEFRMYVINGRCKWGVATRFVNTGNDGDGGVTISMITVAPGRDIWDQHGREAASIAEKIVAIVSREQRHAAHFLRVDMVRRLDGQSWWINELEYFGNAFVHFEAFDNSPELLASVIEMTKRWVLEMCQPH